MGRFSRDFDSAVMKDTRGLFDKLLIVFSGAMMSMYSVVYIPCYSLIINL